MPKYDNLDNESGGTDSTSPPKDHYQFVSFTMFLFGIASLLPWNFFITANSYWMYKFRNTSQPWDPSSPAVGIQKSFESDLSIASKIPYILFLIVNTAVSQRFDLGKRIRYPIVACILLFIVTTILVKVDTDNFQEGFLGITLTLVVLINVFCGFLQGGGTGLAGVFPPSYMAICVLGQASGGVFATLCQLFCQLVGSSPQNSALLYFIIATLLLIITFVCFGFVVKTDFYNYYMSTQATAVTQNRPTEKKKIPYLEMFKMGWHFYACVTLIFWVTIAVFPAVTALTQSNHRDNGSRATNDLFLTLACFLTFNATDLAGRFLAKYLVIPSEKGFYLLALCLSRIVFIPLFLMCNLNAERVHSSTVFPEDWQFVGFMILFGLTNGYVTTLSMTYASKSGPQEYHEVSGSLAAIFLGLGLALGALTSEITSSLV